MQVLALDIGGTHTRLARIDIASKPRILEKKVWLTKNIKSVYSLVKGYKLKKIGIGFAGPIAGRKANLTNAALKIDAAKLEKQTGAKVLLLNDFTAIGYSLDFVKHKTLSKGIKNNISIVIGPGTGLGMAYVIGNNVYPSEAGHTTLGIENIEEYGLLDSIKHKQVYYEHVLSGRGLNNLYNHLEITTNIATNFKLQSHDPIQRAKLITKHCKTDKICGMTLKMFTKFYARFARNAALHFMASQVYLVGGISIAIKPYLEKYFVKEFTNHTVYGKLLKKKSIKLILDEDAGIIGAGIAASK